MRAKTAWCLAVLPCLFLGCKSHPLGPYTSPRVEGRVISGESGQPLAGVKVSRGKPAGDPIAGLPKGGQLLMTKAPVETNPEGRFILRSERVLSIVRGSGWKELRLTFEKAGYERLRTNIPTVLATNISPGEPVLSVGTVALSRTVGKQGTVQGERVVGD